MLLLLRLLLRLRLLHLLLLLRLPLLRLLRLLRLCAAGAAAAVCCVSRWRDSRKGGPAGEEEELEEEKDEEGGMMGGADLGAMLQGMSGPDAQVGLSLGQVYTPRQGVGGMALMVVVAVATAGCCVVWKEGRGGVGAVGHEWA